MLEKIARELSHDVWVVAPEQEQSGASHSLTTRRPLRLTEIGPRRYAVDGTPTDCVLLAVKRLLRDRPPASCCRASMAATNMGEDMTYSGTVAAAMEASLLGVPAIALSQEYRDRRRRPMGRRHDAFGVRGDPPNPRRRAALAERHLLQRAQRSRELGLAGYLTKPIGQSQISST